MKKLFIQKTSIKNILKMLFLGTLERTELIEETIIKHLDKDIDLKKTDKLLKIILFSAVFELCLNIIRQKMLLLVNMFKLQNFF